MSPANGKVPAGADPGLRPRRSYHHGNLREALIEATKRLLAEKGPQGFTLADAARLAGVSAAAPYRHFQDRDAMLAAVAAAGFEAFTRRLRETAAAERDPGDAFRVMGRAYLGFAREEPGYYAAMFSTRLPEGSATTPASDTRPPEDAAASPASDAAFGVLVDGIVRVLEASGAGVPDPRGLAIQIWSLSHGLATLAATGRLGFGGDQEVEALLASGVEALVAAALEDE